MANKNFSSEDEILKRMSEINPDFLNDSEQIEVARFWGKQLIDAMDALDDDDYVINEEQFAKFLGVILFFIKNSKGKVARLDRVELVPRGQHGNLNAYFPLFYASGDEMEMFSEVIKCLSAITIDATSDEEICISITVPNVFIKGGFEESGDEETI